MEAIDEAVTRIYRYRGGIRRTSFGRVLWGHSFIGILIGAVGLLYGWTCRAEYYFIGLAMAIQSIFVLFSVIFASYHYLSESTDGDSIFVEDLTNVIGALFALFFAVSPYLRDELPPPPVPTPFYCSYDFGVTIIFFVYMVSIGIAFSGIGCGYVAMIREKFHKRMKKRKNKK